MCNLCSDLAFLSIAIVILIIFNVWVYHELLNQPLDQLFDDIQSFIQTCSDFLDV